MNQYIKVWMDCHTNERRLKEYYVENLSKVDTEHVDSIVLLDAAANMYGQAKIFGIGIRRVIRNDAYVVLDGVHEKDTLPNVVVIYDLNDNARTGDEYYAAEPKW